MLSVDSKQADRVVSQKEMGIFKTEQDELVILSMLVRQISGYAPIIFIEFAIEFEIEVEAVHEIQQ